MGKEVVAKKDQEFHLTNCQKLNNLTGKHRFVHLQRERHTKGYGLSLIRKKNERLSLSEILPRCAEFFYDSYMNLVFFSHGK